MTFACVATPSVYPGSRRPCRVTRLLEDGRGVALVLLPPHADAEFGKPVAGPSDIRRKVLRRANWGDPPKSEAALSYRRNRTPAPVPVLARSGEMSSTPASSIASSIAAKTAGLNVGCALSRLDALYRRQADPGSLRQFSRTPPEQRPRGAYLGPANHVHMQCLQGNSRSQPAAGMPAPV